MKKKKKTYPQISADFTKMESMNTAQLILNIVKTRKGRSQMYLSYLNANDSLLSFCFSDAYTNG